MGLDCSIAPPLIALLKAIGPAVAIVGAILAWLLNKFLGWCVWAVERFLKRYEVMKALLAEIESNSQAESVYYVGSLNGSEAPQAIQLIENLRRHLGSDKPLAPYVATVPGNPVFENVLASLSLLPARVVRPIINYYSASISLTNQILDFRSETYLSLNQIRQEATIKDLWNVLGRETESTALAARSSLRSTIWLYDAWRYGLLTFAAAAAIGACVTFAHPASDALASITLAVKWASSCPNAPDAKPASDIK
jgi:hypothetical protein